MQIIVITIFIAITFYGCVSPKKNDGKIHVLATTGIIADILSNSLDSSFVVESLILLIEFPLFFVIYLFDQLKLAIAKLTLICIHF